MSYVPSLVLVVWLLIGIVILIVVNALLNAAEAALIVLRPHHARLVRETDAARANVLQSLLDGKETHVAACGLGSRLVRVGLVLMVLALAPAVGHGLARIFGDLDDGTKVGYGWTLVGTATLGVPMALLNLAAGELVPRAYGAGNPLAVLTRLGRVVFVASTILAVPARALVAVTNRFNARFGESSEGALEEEIKTLAESGEESGQIESDERELIHSVFEFRDTVAREIMTPRVDLDSMPVRSEPADVVRVIEETGHSRIPLFEETDDEILGVVHAKDLLGAMAQGRAVDLRRLMRPVLKVPEGKGVHDLLREMRAHRSQMAVVQDEFGGTAGVVTIEDIVEELVGDIVDEYDPEESEIVEVGGGWLVSGKTHLDDMNDRVGTDFESEQFDTLGGFIFGQFGRQPGEGESIDLERYRFTVTETDGRRVGQLRVEAITEPDMDDLSE